MVKQPKTFVVGTYRTTPIHYKPPPPAIFPKNPMYEGVKSKVASYINTVAPVSQSPKPKESSNDTSE
jgi:hypothetical protein